LQTPQEHAAWTASDDVGIACQHLAHAPVMALLDRPALEPDPPRIGPPKYLPGRYNVMAPQFPQSRSLQSTTIAGELPTAVQTVDSSHSGRQFKETRAFAPMPLQGIRIA